MPIYEYTCADCQVEFELLIRSSEEPECPNCQSTQLARQFSVPAAHTTAANRLPVCEPPAAGGCGLPQCGQGRCGME